MNNDTINYQTVFNHVQRFVKNETLAWECVAEAYLLLDKSRDIPQQAAFMYQKTINLAKDKYKAAQRVVCFSCLENETSDEDKQTAFIDNLEYTAFQNAQNDTDVIVDILKRTPNDLQTSMGIVLNAIFDNRIGIKATITVESIRELFANLKHLQGTNMRQTHAKRCYELLQNLKP